MASRKSYKSFLVEARELRGQAGVMAHKRATLLVRVFDDREFRNEVGAIDDYSVAAFLDAEVEDLCLTFLQLREILRHFPDVAAWADGRLRTLYEQAEELGRQEAAKEAKETPPRARRSATVKEMERVEAKAAEAEAALRHKEREVTKALSEIDQLRAENAELKIENARLLGRIEELERRFVPAGV